MNLQLRISSWLILIMLVAAILAVFIAISLQRNFLVHQFEEMAIVVADTVHNSIETAMLTGHRDEVAVAIRHMGQHDLINSVAIFDTNGDVWVSTDSKEELVAGEKASILSVIERNKSDIRPIASDDQSLVCVTTPVQNTAECQRCHNPAQKVNGAVRVCLNTSGLNKEIGEINRLVIIFGAITAVLWIGVLAFALSRIVVAPLRRMVKAVRAFGQGNYTMKMALEVGRDDELGTLARAFNEMAGRISQQTSDLNERITELANELAKLNILGKLESSNYDSGQLLRGLAETTKRLLHADLCSIRLIDDDGRKLAQAALRGRDPVMTTTGSALEDLVFDRVAKTRQAVVVPDMHADAMHADAIHADAMHADAMHAQAQGPDPGFSSLIAVPLIAGGHVLGVVGVFSVARRFGGGDVALLSAIANQAAVAIQNARLYARVSEQSITDGLTGLYNHRYFHEHLEEELLQADCNHAPLSLLFCDIDSFKAFNDMHGHAVGDKALQEVATIIKKCTRSIDTAARYGGEEFAVILPETGEAGALVAAERIRAEIACHPFTTRAGAWVGLTVSIGIATYPNDASFGKELIDKADWAMYYAKRKGRNQARCSQPPDGSPSQIYESQIYESQTDESQTDESQIDESQIDESQVYESQIDESQIYESSGVFNEEIPLR